MHKDITRLKPESDSWH